VIQGSKIYEDFKPPKAQLEAAELQRRKAEYFDSMYAAIRKVLTIAAKQEARALFLNRHKQPLTVALDMRIIIDPLLDAIRNVPEELCENARAKE